LSLKPVAVLLFPLLGKSRRPKHIPSHKRLVVSKVREPLYAYPLASPTLIPPHFPAVLLPPMAPFPSNVSCSFSCSPGFWVGILSWGDGSNPVHRFFSFQLFLVGNGPTWLVSGCLCPMQFLPLPRIPEMPCDGVCPSLGLNFIRIRSDNFQMIPLRQN